MADICILFDLSRQSYYKYKKRYERSQIKEEIILDLVRRVRKRQPMLGGKKLYYLLKADIEKLGGGIGRDKLFSILKENHLLISRRRKYIRTTDSNHSYNVYKNLIKEIDITHLEPKQLLVSDLTYLRTRNRFYYLSIVTDVGSRKIVGYCLSDTLSLDGSLAALKTSLRGISDYSGLIHHSDRGIQYCSNAYIAYLKRKKIKISMSGKGNPYENAIAERVIGILKREFLLDRRFPCYSIMQKSVKQSIEIYNKERPHMSIGMLTPTQRYAA